MKTLLERSEAVGLWEVINGMALIEKHSAPFRDIRKEIVEMVCGRANIRRVVN